MSMAVLEISSLAAIGPESSAMNRICANIPPIPISPFLYPGLIQNP